MTWTMTAVLREMGSGSKSPRPPELRDLVLPMTFAKGGLPLRGVH
jgi:hypothetical protein